jgi:hypothetical protein
VQNISQYDSGEQCGPRAVPSCFWYIGEEVHNLNRIIFVKKTQKNKQNNNNNNKNKQTKKTKNKNKTCGFFSTTILPWRQIIITFHLKEI